MAEDPGFTIPTGSYPTFLRHMQRLSHLPINGTQTRARKGPKFPPGPGSRIYQCVFGPRLKKGTPRYPDDTERLEPVCICVIIGSATDTSIEQLSNRALFKINDAIDKAGVFDEAGILDEQSWDDFRSKDVSDFDETVGSASGFELVRLRFCSGSVFPGVIISGNQEEGWHSSGPSVLTLEIDDKVVDDDDEPNLYSAKIIVNQAAVDAEKAEESQLVEELVMVRCDRQAGRGDLCQGIKIQAAVNPQTWLSNDTAYGEDGEYWYKPESQSSSEQERWHMVLDCVSREGYAFKNGSTQTIVAFGCFKATALVEVESANVLDAQEPTTYGAQYFHYINGPEDVEPGEVGLCYRDGIIPVLWDIQDSTPSVGENWGPRQNLQQAPWALRKNTGGFRIVGILDLENHIALVVADPMLTFVGSTNETISNNGSGDVYIFYWNGTGYVTTNFLMVDVFSFLGAVGSAATVECAWNGDKDGVKWRVTQTNGCL